MRRMMRQYLLGTSLLVAATALGAQEEAGTPLDAEAWEQLMVISAQLYQAGDFDGCTAGYTRALRNVNTRKTRKFEPWRVERAQVGLGGCHLRGGRTRAAEVAFYDVLLIREELHGETEPVAQVLELLAHIYRLLDQPAQSRRALERMASIRGVELPPDQPGPPQGDPGAA